MKLLIPYGVERWSADYLEPDASGGTASCRVPHAIVEPARAAPLRLYDGPYDFIEAPPMQDLADPAAQLDYLRSYSEDRCSLWGKHQKQFVALYFAFVSDEIEANRHALEDKADAYQGLYGYRDWLFSALRPLPQAHLCLTGDGPPVRVDFAFWTGAAVLAVDLAGSETPGAAQRARRERLGEAGVQAVEIPNTALAAGHLKPHLPPALLGFWEHDPIPCGPFIPGTLAAATFA